MMLWRLSPCFSIGLGLALCLGTTLAAQEGEKGGRRGGRGGFGGGFGGMGTRSIDRPTLLGSPQVRTELKVTEEHGKKLDEVLAAHREAAREIFSAGRSRDLSDEERKKAREEMAKKSAEALAKTEAKLAAVLDKTQAKRLDEIWLQQQGAEALVSDQVVAALGLSKEQMEKIKASLATRDAEMEKLRGGFRRGPDGGGSSEGGERPNPEEIREKSEKVRKDAETAALAVLSQEQGEKLAKLKGAAFELDRRSLFGGGRGGRGEGGKKTRPAADDGT